MLIDILFAVGLLAGLTIYMRYGLRLDLGPAILSAIVITGGLLAAILAIVYVADYFS